MMKLVKCIAVVFLQFISFFANAQEIDNSASFRNINSDRYFRLHYENDFFTATDYYYTQGINLEYVHPALKKLGYQKFLFHLSNSKLKYGLSLEDNGYTPTSIRHEEIIYNDRPFAAALFLKPFLIALDSVKQQRTSSSVSIGIMGPRAGGEQMQKSIHKWLNNIEPLGWQHQVANDVIVNYQIEHEKKLIAARHYFLVSTYAQANVGSFNDNVRAGFTLMLGHFYSPFEQTKSNFAKGFKFRFHVYEQPLVSLIGFDATLQGGLFNRTSPYTISSASITRITFQNNFGAVFNIGKIYLEYFQSILTKEFSTGKYHRWGGVRIGFAF